MGLHRVAELKGERPIFYSAKHVSTFVYIFIGIIIGVREEFSQFIRNHVFLEYRNFFKHPLQSRVLVEEQLANLPLSFQIPINPIKNID